jgi:hypothetical protein
VRGVAFVCALVVMGGMWARGQAPPDNPPAPDSNGQGQGKEVPNAPGAQNTGTQNPGAENPKEEKPQPDTTPSANPVQAVEDKTKQAVGITKDAATAGLLKARDWESGWITGVYVGKNRKLVTMTGQERKEYYLRQTLTTPEAYMKRMFAAGIDQASGSPRQWDDGWGGYAERFASREGQFITANTLAAIGNAKLGYEVRYDKCKCSGAWPRTRHAIMRNFLTYDRSEENLRLQWALYGGAFSGGVVATTWKPGSQSYWKNGVWGMVGQAGYGALLNFFTEFSREINRKQGVGR